jgi:hypothetical protein
MGPGPEMLGLGMGLGVEVPFQRPEARLPEGMEGWGAFSFTNIKKKYVDYNGRPNPHRRLKPK